MKSLEQTLLCACGNELVSAHNYVDWREVGVSPPVRKISILPIVVNNLYP